MVGAGVLVGVVLCENVGVASETRAAARNAFFKTEFIDSLRRVSCSFCAPRAAWNVQTFATEKSCCGQANNSRVAARLQVTKGCCRAAHANARPVRPTKDGLIES